MAFTSVTFMSLYFLMDYLPWLKCSKPSSHTSNFHISIEDKVKCSHFSTIFINDNMYQKFISKEIRLRMNFKVGPMPTFLPKEVERFSKNVT